MMSSAAALPADAITMAAAETANKKPSGKLGLRTARSAVSALVARKYSLFDGICLKLAMATSSRVTTRSVTTAEVRPERAPRTPEGVTSFRQVSWLAGLNPSPPSQALHRKAQWHLREDSPPTVAGAAPELLSHRNGATHRIPSWPINAISTPELMLLNVRALFVSTTVK